MVPDRLEFRQVKAGFSAGRQFGVLVVLRESSNDYARQVSLGGGYTVTLVSRWRRRFPLHDTVVGVSFGSMVVVAIAVCNVCVVSRMTVISYL